MSFLFNYFMSKNQIEVKIDHEVTDLYDNLEKLNLVNEPKVNLKVNITEQFKFINKLTRQEKIKILNSLEDKNDIVNCFLNITNEEDKFYIYAMFNKNIKE